MCNENVNENAQIRPVCDAKIEADIANQRKKDWEEEMALAMCRLEMPKNKRICRLADENVELSAKIRRLENFLNNNPERFASEKQVELMRGQLEAMENYKRFLSCRIADLALSDLDKSEKEKE